MQTSELNPVFRYVVLAIPVSILLILPGFSDPINLPKLLSLIPITLITISVFIALRKYPGVRTDWGKSRVPLAVYSFLGLSMVISGFVGSKNVVRVLFGAEGRNNGLIYYLIAIILSIVILSLSIEAFELIHLNNVIAWTSLVFASYCLIQVLDLDFISWNNPYNKVIGTLGNPNFSSSALAIFAVFWLYKSVSIHKKSRPLMLSSLGVSILLIYLAWSTQSLQGLIVFAAGLGLIGFAYAREKLASPWAPFAFLFVGAVGLIFAFASFLGLGPLGSTLEQYTLKLRGWYALFGIRGMIDSPWTGVGVDNYVSAFRRFRTEEFVLQYGSTLSVNNAHSTPVQIGASFGMLVFMAYCLLQLLVLYRALQILSSRDQTIPHLKVIAILWILVVAQSILSIEIIGLGILNWLLGACLLSASTRFREIPDISQKKSIKIKKAIHYPVWTGALAIASGTIGSLVFIPVSTEDRAYVTLAFTQFNDSQGKELVRENFDRLSDLTLLYPEKLDKIVGNMVQVGLSEEAGLAAKNLYENDTNDVYAMHLLANYYRNSRDLTNELNLREQIRQLDPWNEKLEFALAQVYADQGDIEKLKISIEKIKKIKPDSVEYREATLLLDNLTANP